MTIGTGALLLGSPGQPAPLRDAKGEVLPGSLSERVTLTIGGVDQGMFIQTVDPSNPVLLFLHGGPGMPEFFLDTTHPTGLERHFTMAWWEQRGAGMSFSRDIPPESMTVERLVDDAIEVADYLRDRFGQDRIYLLAHSWGSFLGVQVAAKAPDRFHAYIGMGQVVHQLRSELLAHAHMVTAYRDRGDARMVRKLDAAPVTLTDGLSPAYMRLRDAAMHGLGIGTTRDMTSVVTGIFLPVWRSPAYTLREKVAVWRGIGWSRQFLWEDFLRTDMSQLFARFDLPVYLLTGRHDYTASQDLARAWFDRIEAPVKGFYWFENSAHSPVFEEPAKAQDILLTDVVRGAASAADAT